MKNITFNSNFGRFAYSISTTIGDDVNEATSNLCLRGLADTGFRGVASEVEKELVKGGYATKDTKRAEIAYSDEAAEVVGRVAQQKLNEIATKANLPAMTFAVTGEHQYGEQEQSRAMATAMWNQVKDNPAMRAALAPFGVNDDTVDEAGIEAAHKFLATLRKPREKKS